VRNVLDVGPSSSDGPSSPGHGAEAADLAVFVDRLASAGSDDSTRKARTQVRRSIGEGNTPPGLRKLAEALAAAVGEPPSQRRPADEPRSIVAAMQSRNLVVLEDFGPADVGQAVAALVADGRRVLVTAATGPELASIRAALPADTAHRALDRLPSMPPAELRELRRLLATSTPDSRARREQQLPPPARVPNVADVSALCEQVHRGLAPNAHGLIPRLLAGLDPERLAAVVSVARCVDRALGALRPREDRPWAWSLLSDLVYSRHRAVFERMLADTAQAAEALADAAPGPPVEIVAPLPGDAADILIRYAEYLQGGGRARAYFRSSIQREALPVLRRVRVDGRVPETLADVYDVLRHLEIGERLARVEAGCAETGIPVPRTPEEFADLTDSLVKIAAGARMVGALKHDVLFLHPNSPLSVPDVATAEQITAAILEYAERGSAPEAAARLDMLADELAMQASVQATAPEHAAAVAALRARDAEAYAAAIDGIEAARRQLLDEQRRLALLDQLRADAPELAKAWGRLEDVRSVFGMACFLPVEKLLDAVPPPDSADVVVMLGAAQLGVERLLLAAAAPRLIGVVGPGERANGAPTVLSVLQKAAALVIRGTAGAGRVVQLPPGARPGVPSPRANAG
jgi:hypothetical protein